MATPTQIMPLFKSRPETSHNVNDHLTSSSSPTRKSSIFSRHRSTSPATKSTSGGFFGHRNSSTSRRSSSLGGRDSSQSPASRNGGFFGMRSRRSIDNDPSILNARQKVEDAEAAEKKADHALMQARSMVKEAREHVKILEREVVEDTMRAKAKQAEAKVVSKTAKGLGRHG